MTDQVTLSMSPKTLVGHHRKDDHDVYIGRWRTNGELKHLNNTDVGERGWLGNPFHENVQGESYSLEESLEQYQDAFLERIETDDEFRAAIHDFQGGILGCWCRSVSESSPACHGDVIAQYLNSL